ncbi:hypothetical protein F2Q70_00030293 [Brassica cretica]|uniref:Uncharacterized protein n=2 Tax=Brassica cretica TaxID=69181 RepID=A0A8S9H369_BRACR|nr:hypothetical protein F2Q70_00030293 [Brassica cretica]KAF2552259.1 hypothetical protein F2Q68_00034757 [Brassica cretica]KAF3594113.1 hypothetical protein DY000_02022749 [Brassica cretica]
MFVENGCYVVNFINDVCNGKVATLCQEMLITSGPKHLRNWMNGLQQLDKLGKLGEAYGCLK